MNLNLKTTMTASTTTPDDLAAPARAAETPPRYFFSEKCLAELQRSRSARNAKPRRAKAKTCPTPHKTGTRCRPKTILRANKLPLEAFLLDMPLNLPEEVILNYLGQQPAYQRLTRQRALELHQLVKQRVAHGQALLEVERVIHQAHAEGWSLPVFLTKIAELGYEFLTTKHGVEVRQLTDALIYEPGHVPASLMDYLLPPEEFLNSESGSLKLKLLAVRLQWLKQTKMVEGLTDAACRRILPALYELEQADLLDAVDQSFRDVPGSERSCARFDHFVGLLESKVKNTWFSPEMVEVMMAKLIGPVPRASESVGDDGPRPSTT
jgi:hypothetical protein